MAPFTHVSTDRPSRFTDGSYGVLYVGDRFETALFETIHHHARFMARTKEAPGWTSQFREIVMSVDADLHDLVLCRQNRPRRWILTATRHLKLSLPTSGARDQTGLPTRASGIPVGNASLSSTRTARQTPSKGGTSTTTGMARALTLSAMPVRGLFSVSSICRPILSDRMSWPSGRVLYDLRAQGAASRLKSARQPSRVHEGLCPAKPGPCTAGYTVSPLA
jgi:hypothetical protein